MVLNYTKTLILLLGNNGIWLFKKTYFSEIHTKLSKDTITKGTKFSWKCFNRDNKKIFKGIDEVNVQNLDNC